MFMFDSVVDQRNLASGFVFALRVLRQFSLRRFGVSNLASTTIMVGDDSIVYEEGEKDTAMEKSLQIIANMDDVASALFERSRALRTMMV